ncbi:hypothetical protein ACIRTB_08600 [Streptomyces sp. NPDC101158]|uniref:hypothetical protein n=1 Tax=Streptomyces sp. NPDC101158 TaxID=3366117 RepID=UPI00381ADCAC
MSWYVLVETTVTVGGDDRWELVDKIGVEGGREAALAKAQELSRTYVRGAQPEECGRLVFRTSPTSWIVEQTRSFWGDGRESTSARHLHIRVAELEFVKETPPAARPRKGWLRG